MNPSFNARLFATAAVCALSIGSAFAQTAPPPSMTINAGVFNIFDASYFNPADVTGVSATSSLLELYRAPGRSASMNVTSRW